MANFPNNIWRNHAFCYFASFLIASDSSSDLTIFIICSISSFEIINAAVCEAKHEGWPDPEIFFWIAASAADIPADNSNGIKTLLASERGTLFINGKLALINDLRKFRNPPSWMVIFVVVPLNKIPLLSKDLITFITSFISLFVGVIPEPLPVIYYLLNLSICLFKKFFPKFLAISVPFLATLDKIFPKITMSQRPPPNCTILDNWVENFILAD